MHFILGKRRRRDNCPIVPGRKFASSVSQPAANRGGRLKPQSRPNRTGLAEIGSIFKVPIADSSAA